MSKSKYEKKINFILLSLILVIFLSAYETVIEGMIRVKMGSRHWCGGRAKGETPTQFRQHLWTLQTSSITVGR